MGGYRISELAERTGFSASTLRFYEQEGLLPTAARTAGGYRSYDDHTVDRLTFIARAKQLDLPLDEIRELAAVWDAGSCAPVQERLTALIAGKIVDADTRIAELTAFRAQLVTASDGLDQHTPTGPCDDSCGCVTQRAGSTYDHSGPQRVQLLTTRPAVPPITLSTVDDDEPVACTLNGSDQQTRLDQWSRLLAAVTQRDRTADEIRLVLPRDPELIGELARLAALEQQCCRFFDVTIELSADTATMTVRAPAQAQDLLDAVFGGDQ